MCYNIWLSGSVFMDKMEHNLDREKNYWNYWVII